MCTLRTSGAAVGFRSLKQRAEIDLQIPRVLVGIGPHPWSDSQACADTLAQPVDVDMMDKHRQSLRRFARQLRCRSSLVDTLWSPVSPRPFPQTFPSSRRPLPSTGFLGFPASLVLWSACCGPLRLLAAPPPASFSFSSLRGTLGPSGFAPADTSRKIRGPGIIRRIRRNRIH